MSEAVGPLALENDGGRAMFGQGVEGKEYSETTSALIDAEVKRIMTEATERARDVLTDRRAVLDAIAQKLIEVETLEQPEYEALISSHGIPLKKIES
jgi:cell division protease FtsH